MSVDISADLDDIFAEIGEFGPHQIVTILLLCALNILSGASAVNYIISANTLDYRCKVPECEDGKNNRDIIYDQLWLKNAIPTKDKKLESCYRFKPKNFTISEPPNQCTADMFDSTTKITCTEYIYASDENNLQTEFNINCLDTYKLALVGSIGNIARFIFLPFTGLLSDRFGRLPGIVLGTQLSFIFSFIKSYSVNYTMYIALEFLEATTFAFCFSGIYLFAVELLSVKYRVLGSTLLNISFATGGMFVGLVAMYIHNFRNVIRIFAVPGLFVFTYLWLIPESVRWLLVTHRVDRAIKTLKKIAKFNGHELSEKNIESIKLKHSQTFSIENDTLKEDTSAENQSILQLLWTVLRTKRLCLRFLSCCFQWATCCFSYYGLSQSSTRIAGSNRYINFILVTGIEIPSGLLTQPLLKRMKRRVLLLYAFLSTAIVIIITPFIPEAYPWAVIVCFVIGKGAINVAFITVYLFTNEQFPTNIRSTIMNTCSMMGRVGSIIAPFVVILGSQYSSSLQAILFSGSAVIAAILLIFNVETFKKKLPDTIEEAIYL